MDKNDENKKGTPKKGDSPKKKKKKGVDLKGQPKLTDWFAPSGSTGEPKRKVVKFKKLLPNLHSNVNAPMVDLDEAAEYSDTDVEILPPPTPPPIEVVTLESETEASQEVKMEVDKVDSNEPKVEQKPQIVPEIELLEEDVTFCDAPKEKSNGNERKETSGNSDSGDIEIESDTTCSESDWKPSLDSLDSEEALKQPNVPSTSTMPGTRKSSRLQYINSNTSIMANVENVIDSVVAKVNNELETQLIDISEEVDPEVNSLSEIVQVTTNKTAPSTPTKSGPEPATRSPAKTPKKNLGYFSPIRQFQKRSSSSSTLPASSPSKSGIDQGPPKFSRDFQLENFMTVVDAVRSEPLNAHLLDEEDQKSLDSFEKCSEKARRLFARLFWRKWKWNTRDSIKYDEIDSDLSSYFEELARCGFLLSLSNEVIPLKELLDILNKDQLNELGKKMGFKKGKNKSSNKEQLLALAQTKNSLSITGGPAPKIIKNAKELLGPTYKLSEGGRNLFGRISILYSPPQYWDDEQDLAANQRLLFFLTNTGKISYPTYSINRTISIYTDKEELASFQEAWQFDSQMKGYLEEKKYKDAVLLLDELLLKVQPLLDDKALMCRDLSLPQYLRVYKATGILLHTLSIGIDALQKLKLFAKANQLITDVLLKQEVHCSKYRGRWYDRLIVNAKHLKKSETEIIEIIDRGLGEADISEAHRYSLTERKGKILKSIRAKKGKAKGGKRGGNKKRDSSSEDSEEEEDSEDSDVEEIEEIKLSKDIPTRTIEGEKMERPGEMGKSIFIGKNGKELSSVESFAQAWFEDQGYIYGAHGEGSTPGTLYALLFYDIIYGDIPNVFFSVFQPFPLDMLFPDFYTQRKEALEERLALIRSDVELELILNIIEENYNNNLNRTCLINWTVLNLDQIKTLIRSMGSAILASICEKFARDFRYYRKGFPDLIVWDGTPGRVLFSEIKGPNDKLSFNQILWLNALNEMGGRAEVCNVKAVSNKKIQKPSGSNIKRARID